MFRQFIKALERLEPIRISWARSPIGCSAGASSSGKGGSIISSNLGTPSSAQVEPPSSAQQEILTSPQQETPDNAKQETPSIKKETTPSAFESNRVTREQKLTHVLKKSLPGITYCSIEDISGGCGAMFEINVEAKEFNGLTRLKQHRLVTDSLKKEIPEMHGIRINTTAPPPEQPTPSK